MSQPPQQRRGLGDVTNKPRNNSSATLAATKDSGVRRDRPADCDGDSGTERFDRQQQQQQGGEIILNFNRSNDDNAAASLTIQERRDQESFLRGVAESKKMAQEIDDFQDSDDEQEQRLREEDEALEVLVKLHQQLQSTKRVLQRQQQHQEPLPRKSGGDFEDVRVLDSEARMLLSHHDHHAAAGNHQPEQQQHQQQRGEYHDDDELELRVVRSAPEINNTAALLQQQEEHFDFPEMIGPDGAGQQQPM